jgi:hypothetical protein
MCVCVWWWGGGGVNIKRIFRKMGCNVMNRIDQAQDRDQWRVPVNTTGNLEFP